MAKKPVNLIARTPLHSIAGREQGTKLSCRVARGVVA